MWGDWFLRVQELGKLEGPEEVKRELRKCRRRFVVEGKGKGKEPERKPEVGLEVAPEDVEMTLQ